MDTIDHNSNCMKSKKKFCEIRTTKKWEIKILDIKACEINLQQENDNIQFLEQKRKAKNICFQIEIKQQKKSKIGGNNTDKIRNIFNNISKQRGNREDEPTQNGLFEKTNEIVKPLVALLKKETESYRGQINNIRGKMVCTCSKQCSSLSRIGF